MAAPCIVDGNGTHFYMDGTDLRVDAKVSSKENNALVVDTVGDDEGFYVGATRSRIVTGTSNVVTSGLAGVSVNGFGSVHIDISSLEAGKGSAWNEVPIELTNTTLTTYQNTTIHTEVVTIDFIMGQSIFVIGAGWDFNVGLKMGWYSSGVSNPSFDTVSGLRVGTGFNTGRSGLNVAIPVADEPMGVTLPPYIHSQSITLLPDEQVNCQMRLWASYHAEGAPDVDVNQTADILFGSKVRIQAWTKGA